MLLKLDNPTVCTSDIRTLLLGARNSSRLATSHTSYFPCFSLPSLETLKNPKRHPHSRVVKYFGSRLLRRLSNTHSFFNPPFLLHIPIDVLHSPVLLPPLFRTNKKRKTKKKKTLPLFTISNPIKHIRENSRGGHKKK